MTVQADVSKCGLWPALLQQGESISFSSQLLLYTEQRYANMERELLAIVFTCEPSKPTF